MYVKRFARPALMPRNVVWFERLSYLACGWLWLPILLPFIKGSPSSVAMWGLATLSFTIALILSIGMIWSISRGTTRFLCPANATWLGSSWYLMDTLLLGLKLKPLLGHSLPNVPGTAAKFMMLMLAIPIVLYALIHTKRFNLLSALALNAGITAVALILMLDLPKRLGPSVAAWIGAANLLIAASLIFTENARPWFRNPLAAAGDK